MQFIMEKEVKDIIPKAVDFNYEQLKKELEVKLKNYQNMVVTEDSTKEAKADRATLNKLKKAMDDKRIEIKKEWNVPYIEFENKVKVLTGMIEEPIQAIDKQVKVYEQKVKDEKQEEIKIFFNENISDLKSLVEYSKIHSEKWLNASVKITAVKKEITETIEAIKTDIDVIKGLEMECEQQMIDKYLISFSMAEAMAEKTRWEEQIRKMAEYEKKQAEKKALEEKQKEELNKAKAESAEAEIETVLPDGWESTSPSQKMNAERKPQLETLDFRVYVTKEQMDLLKAFLVNNKIKYGRVTK